MRALQLPKLQVGMRKCIHVARMKEVANEAVYEVESAGFDSKCGIQLHAEAEGQKKRACREARPFWG